MNFQKISLKNKRQTTSNTDLNQFRLDHKSCITKKRSSLFGLDHLEYENGFLFRSLSRKSFLNKRDYKIKECETLNWKMMAIASDSKSILNELNKTDYEYEMDLENNNYEFKLNNYELCYDSSDFLEVNIYFALFLLFTFRDIL